MATKPTTLPRVWAVAGVYATGPFIGSVSNSDPGAGIAGEGHRPGSLWPTAAEHENYQQLKLTTWTVDWLAQGSSLGAADAHIVETNSTGRTILRALTITNTVDETAFSLTSVNTVVPAVAFTCTTGATVIVADIGNSAGKGFGVTVGSGAGTGFDATLLGSPDGAAGFAADLIGAAFGAFGVRITADNTSSGGGIQSSHAGTYYAIEAISTGLVAAFNATATAASTVAASITGGSARALAVLSGTTAGADAIHARTDNTSGFGVRAFVKAGATSAARGFFTSVTDSAVGAEFIAAGNHALIITGDTTSPTYGALKITECNAVPSSFLPNQIALVRPAFGVATQLMESCLEDAGWRGFLSTPGGSAAAQAYDAAGSFSNVSGLWVDALTFSATGGNAPKTAGRQVLIRISLSASPNVAAMDAVLGLRIRDLTAPGAPTVWSRFGLGAGASSGWRLPATSPLSWGPPIAIIVPLTVPAAGPRSWRLEFQTASATGISIRDVSVDFLGMR